MELKNGGKWREVGDMWEEGERRRLGKIVVVDDEENGVPAIFMLDGSNIFRYDMAFNRWQNESDVPRKAPPSFGFVALNGELHVMNLLKGVDQTEPKGPGIIRGQQCCTYKFIILQRRHGDP